MRIVKVGAIQPRYPSIPGQYDCLSHTYRNDPRDILERHLLRWMDVTTGLLEQAGRDGCDIVTTCEDAAGTGYYNADITGTNIFHELVALSYPVMEARLADLSRKHSMNIVGCYLKQVNGKVYNTATVFDRSGSICGEYRKTHLPPDETWQITPGEALEPIDTDFGRIGVCICYDMMFPECVETLALKGAEAVFHPTAGYGWYDGIGEATLRTRANDNGVHIVTAKSWVYNRAGKSSVIDHWGHVLADAGFAENAVVSSAVDLDSKKTQPSWFNPVHMSGTDDVTLRTRRERMPELYSAICSPNADRFAPPSHERQLEILEGIKAGRCRW